MITREQIFDFIQKQKTAFIASIDKDGFPNLKAMNMPRKIDGCDFYFSTNTSSMRVAQYRENPKASIYFYHKSRFRYEGIGLVGTMTVLEDAKSKEDIWEDGDTIYYSKGVTDPDYCVLKFTAVKGRRYCSMDTEDFKL